MKSLHQYLHPDYLPEDYGGNKPKMDYSSADWYPTLHSMKEFIAGNHCVKTPVKNKGCFIGT